MTPEDDVVDLGEVLTAIHQFQLSPENIQRLIALLQALSRKPTGAALPVTEDTPPPVKKRKLGKRSPGSLTGLVNAHMSKIGPEGVLLVDIHKHMREAGLIGANITEGQVQRVFTRNPSVYVKLPSDRWAKKRTLRAVG